LESSNSGAAIPVLFLGRYRLQRINAVQTQQMQVSNEASNATVSIIAHDSNGNPVRTLLPSASYRTNGLFVGRLTGAHISFKLQGRLNLTAFEAELTSAGSAMLPVQPTALVNQNNIVVQNVPVTVEGQYVEVT
jgi:hypothetical protein